MIKPLKQLDKKEKDGVFQTWSPMFKDPPEGDMNEYRQYIFDHITFSKVLRALKLRPEECSTNRYSHRMICPFKFHKNGRERTGSFRFSDKKKVFTCFGCNESGDILKFLSLYCGGCEQFHLKRLAGLAGLLENTSTWVANDYTEQDNESIIREANHQALFDAGLLLRNYLHDVKNTKNYVDECEWVDQMFIKIDKYFETLDSDNTKDIEKILSSLNSSIAKRKNKLGR